MKQTNTTSKVEVLKAKRANVHRQYLQMAGNCELCDPTEVDEYLRNREYLYIREKKLDKTLQHFRRDISSTIGKISRKNLSQRLSNFGTLASMWSIEYPNSASRSTAFVMENSNF